MIFNQAVEAIGRAVDVAGVLAIAGGIGLTILLAAGRVWRHEPDVYRSFRQQVGCAILLGFELLVAADINEPWLSARRSSQSPFSRESCSSGHF